MGKLFSLVAVIFLLSCSLAHAGQVDTFNALLALARKGDAEAQYHVGMMYNNGIGTKSDPKQAFAWFEKAALARQPLGAYKLGCYYDGQGGVVAPDAVQALKYKRMAAEAGYSLAQHDTANLYGKQGNFEEAVKWWKKAGDQGFPMALYNVSMSYYEGKGVAKDDTMAYAYFKLAKLASGQPINATAQATLDEMAAKAPKADVEKADRFVATWKAQPTALTLKARNGLKEAEGYLKSLGKS